MLTPQETHVIRQRALLAQQLEPSDGSAVTLAATLAADVLLLDELRVKDAVLGHLVHGSAEQLYRSPATLSPPGDSA
jgi:hypothetical protein